MVQKKTSIRDFCSIVSGTSDDSFVGIKVSENEIVIKFPVGYEISDDDKELKKDILKLIKTVNLAKKVNLYQNVESINDVKNNIPLYSYFYLISDYLKYDLYRINDKKYSSKNGSRINWKRTIQRSQPYICDDNLIFLNPIYEKSINKENVITEIEKYCLNLSIEYFGWYFGINGLHINKSIFDDNNKQFMLNILNKELNSSFLDRKKSLINCMISILNETTDDHSNNKFFSYGTNQYHVAWEKMIYDLYNSEDLKKYYPNGKWHLIDHREKDASSLRPDSIYFDIESGKYYVIDSKYYRFCVTEKIENLPDSTSIQKQITYAQNIEKNNGVDGNKIYNAFILPYNSYKNNLGLSKKIEYFGYADFIDKEIKYPYGKISLILFDTKYLINKWFERNSEDLKDLMRLIENK